MPEYAVAFFIDNKPFGAGRKGAVRQIFATREEAAAAGRWFLSSDARMVKRASYKISEETT